MTIDDVPAAATTVPVAACAVDVVALGASAGGVTALPAVLPRPRVPAVAERGDG